MGTLVAQQTTATAVDENLTTLLDWTHVSQFSGFRWVVENTGGGTGNNLTDVHIDESTDGGTTNSLDEVDGATVVPIAAPFSAHLAFASTAKYVRVRAKCAAGEDTTAKAWLLADTITGRLCTLADVRTRLGYPTTTTDDDDMIYDAIRGVSAQFDSYCNRTLLLNATAATETYDGGGELLVVKRYPIVSVTSVKEATDYDFDNADALTVNSAYRLMEEKGIIASLNGRFITGADVVQVVYTGGYVAPSDTVGTGETALPDDIREAAIEQVSFLVKRKDDIGLTAVSAQGVNITKFSPIDLLPNVKRILNKYRRWT